MDGGPNIKTEIKVESTGWQEDNTEEEIKPNINESFLSQDMIKHEPEMIVGISGPVIEDFNEEHQEPNWMPCLLCGESFLSSEELSLHSAQHTKSEMKKDPLKEQSSKTIVTVLTLQELLQNHVNIAVDLDGETTYTCKLCNNKVFSQLVSIRNHMKIHVNRTYKERSCHICHEKFLLRESLLTHLKVHSLNQKYKCNFCEASFKDSNALYSHQRSHTETPHICPTCNETFSDAELLGKHIKTHMQNHLTCPKCEKNFSSVKSFRNHLNTHTGELSSSTDLPAIIDDKPFKCEMCTYATTQSGYLRRHMRTHTGERPFKCSYCEKAFAERKRLVSHTRSHTGEKPFKCTYCDASYARNDNLKYHLRTHTGERPFECDECGKRFMQRAALVGHKKIHTDEKPFSCPHCEMNFRHSGTLANHLLTHTNERPFKCDLCEKGFTQKVLLKRHITREHADDIVS